MVNINLDLSQNKFISQGARLKRLLEQRGIKQNEFAEIIGVSDNSVTGYVKGKRLPSGENLLAIKTDLDISIDWLLVGDPAVEPSDSVDGLIRLPRGDPSPITADELDLLEDVLELLRGGKDRDAEFLDKTLEKIKQHYNEGLPASGSSSEPSQGKQNAG